jgi:hypothetical protein
MRDDAEEGERRGKAKAKTLAEPVAPEEEAAEKCKGTGVSKLTLVAPDWGVY